MGAGVGAWWWCVWCVWCAWCVCGGCAGAAAAQRPQCAHAPQRCEVLGGAHDEYTYRVDGEEHNIKFTDGGYFSMKCGIKITLDNEALPRFTDEVRVSRIYLIDCAPPNQSYAHVLQRLNVVAVNDLIIRHAPQTISGDHLAGLNMSTLALEKTRLAADAFKAYNVTQLRLDTVKSVAIKNLPASLQYLHLVEVGIRKLTRASFQSLPALSKLTVRQEGIVYVEAMESLTELALQARSVSLDPALPDKLEKISLTSWAQQALVPWKSCNGLKELVIDGDANITLPKGWLTNCPSLSKLSVKNSGLERLPNGLLDNSESLSFLNLSGNRLKELPSGLFAKTRRLTVLDLSDNKLTSDTFSKLGAVTSLYELWLDGNKQLGDACLTGNAASRLQDLRSLRRLHLSNTGAKVVCRDYRENMSLLEKLDLSRNDITQLTYSDLQFEAKVAVELSGNDVQTLVYTHEEYRRLVVARGEYCGDAPARASRASFTLPAELRCDCRSATAALALRRCPAHVRLPALRCAATRHLPAQPLAQRHIDEFVCALAPADCPAPVPCTCAERREAGEQRVVRVQCAGAALGGAPPLGDAPGVAWQLLLANASIAELHRADLPQNLIALDLRGNPLASLEPAVVDALPADGRLWVPRDSLSCDCDNAAGLAALLRRRDLVQNFRELRCAGGAELRPPHCPAPGALLAAALAPPLLLAALAAALLARRSTRARLKSALRGLGVLPPRAERADADADADERPFDVFVSFSHLDSEVVAELLAGLEPRYRVCVHFRDWAPGAWIPAQIAASVRRSRRTLAVVSAHFLRSAWARAEFREAHAAALRDHEPRLVVVLLDEPARLPLDPELRRYLAANTYVRWGDAWFWRKLRAALPPPRPPAPTPPGPLDPAAAGPPAPGPPNAGPPGPGPLPPEPLTGAAA